MSGPSKELDEIGAGSSGMLASSEMEGEDEYYNPDGTEWSQKAGLLCRICANPNEYLIPIFDGEGLEHELGTKIQKHLPIKVTETDTLPIHVCYQCASTLIAWHDLVNCCVEADKKLRELQMVEDDEDDDDKGAEMFESHSFDSEMVAEDDGPSTSELQNQAPEIKSPKKLTVDKKSKLKMVLVKGSAAGTSGQKIVPKIQVAKVELGKPKEGTSQDSASERYQQASFRAFHQAKRAMNNARLLKKIFTAPASNLINDHSVWIKTEIEISSEICNYCGTMFYKTSELASHLTQVHSDHIFHCEMCNKMFKSKELLVIHMKLHEAPPYEKQCQKIATIYPSSFAHGSNQDEGSYIPQKNDLKDLRQSTSDSAKEFETSSKCIEENSHKCTHCGKYFKKLYLLKKHCKSHNMSPHVELSENENVASELESEEEADKESNLECVSGKKEKINKTAYQCEICRKNFTLKDSYKSHQRIHTGEKPFTCHMCGKQFSHTGGLYYHLKHVHAGIKNHSCDICGRCFALKAAMEDHRRIHTGERPYVCHTCGKSFKTKASLYIHSKIHTDSFPHPCSQCERRFRWRQQLIAHMTTHTGEKPYTCEVCGKGFGVKNDLTRHKLTHSDEKPFSCPICGLSFGQKRYLKNHEKSRHMISA